MTKRRTPRLVFVAAVTAFCMAFAGVALADTIATDGDLVAIGNQTSINLGTVAPGASISRSVRFILTCASNKHVDAEQKVNLTDDASTAPAGGSITVGSGSIGPIPSSWPDDTTGPTNCASSPQTLASDASDAGNNASVQITAPTAPDTYTYVAKWSASLSPAGLQDSSSVTGSVPSVTYTLTVAAPACTAPSVTTQPEDQSIAYGDSPSFSAAASGTEPVGVQWQVHSGSAFVDITDETSDTLNLTKPPVSADGNQYRAVFTNACGSATSDPATLNVTAKNLTITDAVAQDKYFDDTTAATVDFSNATLNGVVGNDGVDFDASNYSASFSTKAVGINKPVTVTGVVLTGTDADNYTLSQPSGLTASILAWTLSGFYAPVDMSTNTTTVVNTVKGGSTVPLKFEAFAGSTELTNTSAIDAFVVNKMNCNALSGEPEDVIELTTTGGTSLRYDTTGGQFIQNWQTPKGAGVCYAVTMKTDDGSSIGPAFFKTK